MRKIITASLLLIALAALELPTAASATSPEITHPTGTRLDPTGTTCTGLAGICLIGHNVGNSIMYTAAGNTVCNEVRLTGMVTANPGTGTAVEVTIENANFESDLQTETRCTGPTGAVRVITNIGSGLPWCVRAFAGAAMEVQVRGNRCSKAARSLTFAFAIGSLLCRYERTTVTGPVKGNYTTDTAENSNTDATIHIPRSATGSNFAPEPENSFLCPAGGELEMSITLETDNANTEPLYFS